MEKSSIGIVGLGTMGQNLALNLAQRNRVSAWNRSKETQREFQLGRASETDIRFCGTLEQLVESLEPPRVILLMVKAGEAVDEMIAQLSPLLSDGDILIDGGNSHYKDTGRRVAALSIQGIRFVGAGISGGEEGALHGASIMPGGDLRAWPVIKPLLQGIAAKGSDGTPCCEWIGPEGSGHFIKMVHNGLEYADMQLIAEACSLLLRSANISREQMAAIIRQWNAGRLNCYLLEIAADILVHRGCMDGYLLDHISDAAGQKGTGRWCVETALELGIPVDGITSAVSMRHLSSLREWREKMAMLYRPLSEKPALSHTALAIQLEAALYAARIVNYSQGFALIRQASDIYGWNLNLSSITKVWRNGCIIRSAFLDRVIRAYEVNPKLDNLLLDSQMMNEVKEALPAWRQVVETALAGQIAVTTFSSLLNYLYAATEKTLPTRLIQAMRDYFGAHKFERTDAPRGQLFHEIWRRE